MSVRDRLTALESAAGMGACEACGMLPNGLPPGEVRFVLLPIVWDANGRQMTHPEPERCPTCGVRPVRITLGPLKLDGDKELA